MAKENAQIIERTPIIMSRVENYFKKSISASAINTYLRCPLDFYYKYIAELGEERNVEEDIESQNMPIKSSSTNITSVFASMEFKSAKKSYSRLPNLSKKPRMSLEEPNDDKLKTDFVSVL